MSVAEILAFRLIARLMHEAVESGDAAMMRQRVIDLHDLIDGVAERVPLTERLRCALQLRSFGG